MNIEIRQVETLTDAEKQQLFGWGEDIFGVASLNLSWRPKDLHFLLYAEGLLVSHVGGLKNVVNINGESATVGGVGGVVTIREARKKGFARQLMQHTIKFFKREWEVDAGLLFCPQQMVAYYESLGWESVSNTVLIEQPNGQIASPLHVMVLPFDERSWSAGSIELQSLPW